MLRKCGIINTFLLLIAICSCTRTVYQEHEVIKHDSIYITALAVDTILQRDSIHIRERGDTIEKVVYKYIYKVRERADTCYISKTDTITNNVTKIEVKTRYRKDWLSIIGALVIGAIVGVIIRSIKQ